MIEGLKPYGNYKSVQTREGHIPWLYTLPAHWSVSPSKWLFVQRQDRARPDDQQLSATQAYGVILQKEFERRVGRKVVQIVQHLDKRRHVECDDFVISMRSFQGGLERAWASGAIRSSYVVLKPTVGVDVGYFSHLFKSKDYISALQRTSNFIRDGQDLNFNNFRLVDLPVVPPEEQRAIAKFINHADRRIRRYIRAKQKLIKLLEEQKQAIIHQAVTRGLDPNVRLKPSGVEWLGDVPAHWQRVRLGRVARVFNGTTPSRARADYWQGGQHPWLSSGKVNDGVVMEPSELITDSALQECPLRLVPRGSLIIGLVGQGKTRGMAALLGLDAHINQNIAAIVPDVGVSSEFLVRWLQAAYKPIRELGRGGNQEAMNCEIVGRIPVMLPPPAEQREMVSAIERQLTKVSTSEVPLHQQVDLLREYRTRLIADVVTGKLDVREAAANLPDQPDEDDLEVDDADEIEDQSDLPDAEDSE